MFGSGFFRLFLAMCVCIAHLSRANIGETAVCVFFLLSGYWVVRMYCEKYVHLPFPNSSFWIARFLRIWVVYAACLTLAMAVFAIGFDHYRPNQWYGLLLFGTGTHGNDILRVSWSLDIEVQFYVLVPLLVAVFLPAFRSGRIVLAALVCVLLTSFGLYFENRFDVETVFAYIPLFLAGALIHEFRYRPGATTALASGAIFLVVGGLILAHPYLGALLDKTTENPFNDRWFAIVWSLFLVPFVAWNVEQNSSAIDRHLGNLSYCVYLIHFPFYEAARIVLGGGTQIEKLGLLFLTLPVALIPYVLVDRPVERYRERLSYAVAAWLNGWRRTTAPSLVAPDRSPPAWVAPTQTCGRDQRTAPHE